MKKIFQYALVILFFLSFSSSFAQQKSAEKTVGPAKGSLIIVGGGSVGPEIWAKFIELAGGPNANIVVVPTAADDSSLNVNLNTLVEVELLHNLGVKQVTVLHTRDAKEANQEKFVAPLKKATGVWFTGGRQWRLADSYLNTQTHKELQALLNRGGVIAGTSAGATILGSFLLRGDTKGNTTLVGDHTQGLDFLHNVAIDQHILKRNRQFDLIEVIKARPGLLGIGIDESTAIVVQKDAFQVIGNSFVAIYDNNQFGGQVKSPAGNNGTTGPFYFLNRGQRFDLKNRKVIAEKSSISAKL